MPSRRLRPSGTRPFWSPGARITWHEGAGPLGTGPLAIDPDQPHFASPVTVVSDDPDSLVVWLPVGTPVLRAERADGRSKRDDPTTLFTAEMVQGYGVHEQYDQLRIAPTGQPWSVWILREPGAPGHACWYVNLEAPHRRDARGVFTSDHVLDLVVGPDCSGAPKDEDELGLAVAQGVFSAQQARRIVRDCARVERLVEQWASPFCDGWERWRTG
ncbi:DUF402 domain-containing protein [Nocardioides acrostichi]|uniref:DUF402 domain-containing protein n=1 Tax=Nocardioides acrostichi TaxID=2784339 RepID=A0A930UVY6_9ACTN|nr:DUF402 domain-containing protein [Nocardioides acrostichi]MBF4161863.1 DUF402 domain-containing protein [Nocardioides acrostichi]